MELPLGVALGMLGLLLGIIALRGAEISKISIGIADFDLKEPIILNRSYERAFVGLLGCASLITGIVLVRPGILSQLNALDGKPTITMLGQDGTDYTVSGCPGGTLGQKGVVDNHIRLTGLANLDRLKQVNIEYDDPVQAHWQYPCTTDIETGVWNIHVERTNANQLDLYFEPTTIRSVSVVYTVILQYTDGDVSTFTVTGPSGVWHAK